MTCQHVYTDDVALSDHKHRVCRDCLQRWVEFPIAMTDAEYDSALLVLAAWHLLDRARPDDRTQA